MEKVISFFKEIGSYVLVIAIIILLKTYVVAPIKVNGVSMDPTLEDKDIMILDKISYHFSKIKRFDIVVIKVDGDFLIKRVVGLPGEKIEYKNNVLYINDKPIKEEYDKEYTNDFSVTEFNKNKIPEDSYFVLGDNRTVSKDSRGIGFIDREQIIGKSNLTLYPFNRIGIKK